MSIEQAKDLIYESVKGRTPFGLEEFKEKIADWDIIPLYQNGVLHGGVMVKDSEIHIGLAIKPQACGRHYVRGILKDIMDKFGFVTTQVMRDNPNGLRFCKRLGFVPYQEQADRIFLKCDRSRYVP